MVANKFAAASLRFEREITHFCCLFRLCLFLLLQRDPVVAFVVRCRAVFFFPLFCGACLLSAVPLLSRLPLPSVESWVRYVLDLWILW